MVVADSGAAVLALPVCLLNGLPSIPLAFPEAAGRSGSSLTIRTLASQCGSRLEAKVGKKRGERVDSSHGRAGLDGFGQ